MEDKNFSILVLRPILDSFFKVSVYLDFILCLLYLVAHERHIWAMMAFLIPTRGI